MFVYILLGFFTLVVVTCVVGTIWTKCYEMIGPSIIICVIISFGSAVPVCVSWNSHAGDLGIVAAQDHVIKVYERRRTDLTNTLKTFQYPQGSLLNADTPVGAIVTQLAEVEKDLGKARQAKAKAIVSIEQRRLSLMSPIVGWVGDYK